MTFDHSKIQIYSALRPPPYSGQVKVLYSEARYSSPAGSRKYWQVVPEPLDVGVFLVANASHHSVAVHCINEVRVLLCALSSAAGFQKEGVVISGFLGHQLKLLNASGVLDGIVQCVVFLYDGWDRYISNQLGLGAVSDGTSEANSGQGRHFPKLSRPLLDENWISGSI